MIRRISILSLIVLAFLVMACSPKSVAQQSSNFDGEPEVANCVDNDGNVVEPRLCEEIPTDNVSSGTTQSQNQDGGDNTLRNILIYYWLFGGHTYYPVGYVMSPSIVSQYRLTRTPPSGTVYRASSGSSISSTGGKVNITPPKTTSGSSPLPAQQPAKPPVQEVKPPASQPIKPPVQSAPPKPPAPSAPKPSFKAPSGKR